MKDSELELRPIDITSGSEPKRHEHSEKDDEPKSLLSKLRAAIAYLVIEPFLLCYIFPSSLSSIAVQRLTLEKACRVDLGYTKEQCDGRDTNITIAVQTVVVDKTTWQVPLSNSIPAIVILFIGAWSDRTGNRKALMIIPMFGELVSSFGLLLTTYYFHEWPLFVTTLIESLPSTLTGGISVALMGSYSYLADVTSLESRTLRIGIAVAIVTMGAPAAISISGVLLEAIGFYGIFGLTTCLYALGLLYTYFWIHDENLIKTEGTWYRKLISFFHPKNAWDTLCIAFKRGPNRMKIILVNAAHVVLIGPVYGEISVQYQYMLLEYNMDDVEISFFYTYSILISICGTVIAMALFCKLLKIHDAIIGIIATAGKVMSCVAYAAPTKSWYYSGPALDIFGEAGFVAIRSLGTKVVPAAEVAKMCSLLGLVDTITPMIYSPMYTQMYKATLVTLPGAFYLLGCAMTIPTFFIFITLYMLIKKEERDTVTNPESKERYTHDNDMTEL